MQTIGDRIKFIRKEANLTQQKFADRIGAKQNTIAQYEINRNIPLDPVVTAICKEFDIQEDWLRHGIGAMRVPKSEEEETFEMVSSVLNGSPDFKRAVVKMICSRTPEELKVLEKAFMDVLESIKKE